MKLSVMLHENGGYAVYGKDIEPPPQNIQGDYFYFDPQKMRAVCSTTREKSDSKGRDTQFTVAVRLKREEVADFLEDPYQIAGLKQWLMKLQPEMAKEYAKTGVQIPKNYFLEMAKDIEKKYPILEEKKDEILGIMAAIVKSIGSERIALVLRAEEHSLYAAISCLPINLRGIAFCAPCYCYGGVEYGVINLVPEMSPYDVDLPTGNVSRFSLMAIQKQKFYEDIRWFFAQKDKSEDLHNRFYSYKFAEVKPELAAQAILRYREFCGKYQGLVAEQHSKEKKRTLNELKIIYAENPALAILLPELPQEKTEKKPKVVRAEEDARKNRHTSKGKSYEKSLGMLEKLCGVAFVLAGVLVAAVSRKVPELVIRFEFNSLFLLSILGVFCGGYFFGKSAGRRTCLEKKWEKQQLGEPAGAEKISEFETKLP